MKPKATERSSKRSDGADGEHERTAYVSEAKTRKADDATAPTADAKDRKSWLGPEPRRNRAVVNCTLSFLITGRIISSIFRNRTNGEESPNTEGGGQYAYDFNS